MKSSCLSVVIPTYQETIRLARTLSEIIPYLESQFEFFEVLIVDDPSTKGKHTELETAFAADHRIRLLRQRRRLGKGASLRRGLLESRHEIVLFMDADHTTPIQEVEHFISNVRSGEELVLIGGVRAYQEDESKKRRIVGICAQLLFHLVIFAKAVPDSQCGFKVLTRATINRLLPLSRTRGGMIDAELFYLAHRNGVQCLFEPVRWRNKAGSKINLVKCLFVDVVEVFVIALRGWVGVYDHASSRARIATPFDLKKQESP
jgi:dolichyl-phosphate beta-glucosyltransferase